MSLMMPYFERLEDVKKVGAKRGILSARALRGVIYYGEEALNTDAVAAIFAERPPVEFNPDFSITSSSVGVAGAYINLNIPMPFKVRATAEQPQQVGCEACGLLLTRSRVRAGHALCVGCEEARVDRELDESDDSDEDF